MSEGLEDARWQLALCDCGKCCGSYEAVLCEFCWTATTHCVEMRLTPASVQLYALRYLPAYKELGLGR